ncbi:MAG TPA: phosphate ABC transporter permease PstA [Arsenicitalea sp.]|jgi:phosphate transport system permease protein|nr:phosphate ABC transporter permease PstA [Arsenicitalea sp.]
MSISSRRKTTNTIALALATAATVVGLFFLAAILVTLVIKGFSAISPGMFLENTPPPGSDGGLLNAIFGSVAMTAIAIIVATPIGILAGTYLTEYSRGSRLAEVAKFINDILLSAPSIIIGLFVYTILVVPFHHFSAWAGAAALGIIALPVINRTTQDMLALVPNALREAAAALGTPRWKTMTHVIYRAARSGILTGVLLAIARVTGETAPLLFTALNNQFWSSDLGAPMANLPVVIFQFALSPYDDWQKLAWGGALIVTVTILALNIIARSLAGDSKSQ